MDKYIKPAFYVAVIIILLLLGKWYADAKDHEAYRFQQENLNKALMDSVHHFKNKEGEWVSEKRTIQGKMDQLSDQNLKLSADQSELLKQVQAQNKTSQTFAAALVNLTATVANMKDNKPVAETDSTDRFAKNTPNFEYDVTVHNVKRFNASLTPSLSFNSLSFPNKQEINFHWMNDKKEGYPVSFSVANSNPYFKVTNIESYAIPELTREKVKPTFWQKVGNFSRTTGGKVVFGAVGFGLGYGIAKK